MEKIEKIKNKCKSLEKDIQELTGEIIELKLSRDNLIDALKKARRKIYKKCIKEERKALKKSDDNPIS